MKTITVIKLRRLSQILFLVFFLFLLLNTEFRGSIASAETEIRMPYPVSLFLEIDPLASITNALATHALYRRLFWSLVIIIPTFFLGRFFCGWICPLGTLNHFFSNFKSERKKGTRLIESNRYKKWQTLKYYILIAVLLLAVFGSQIAGVFDPISLTVRSLSISILPALNYGFNTFFDAVNRSEVGILQQAGNALQLLLKNTLLSFKQPHFKQAFFIGLIFVVILFLNLRITRFWCRALCPLGALLGIFSR
ncbi:MAG: 4Fe-4S binding protein, partial [bacterium]